VDEGAVAAVHQRAVIVSMLVPSSSNRHVLLLDRGIIVHHNTSVYNNRNQVELRLGTIIEVHEPVILLTISQTTLNYIIRHSHTLRSKEPRSQ
jgi:hypothetical protein